MRNHVGIPEFLGIFESENRENTLYYLNLNKILTGVRNVPHTVTETFLVLGVRVFFSYS